MPSQEQLLKVIEIQTEIVKAGLDLGEVMALVVERTLDLIDADGAVIELAQEGDMVYAAASGIAGPHLGLRLRQANSLSGMCVESGSILRSDDTEQDARVDQVACRRIGLRSMIVMPLKFDNKVVGVLKAMSEQPRAFRVQDEALLGLLSDLVAAAMHFATQLDSDKLFQKATHDGLTDLANRSLFMDRLRKVAARKGRERRPACVLMIDMDGLKQLNDTFGHRVGDAALREVAKRLKTASRESDTVARLGGDEFAVLLAPVEPSAGVDTVVQRLYANVVGPFRYEDQAYDLSVSIGAACLPDDSDDIEQLLDVADRRMYSAKQAHRRRKTDSASL
ncbi:MAG: GGDEF domain-containing protein [Rhodocyclaceae bacterium]|nr:MAG: GGDEF domain-containing protein [Rhodocyclaceae bacterium]